MKRFVARAASWLRGGRERDAVAQRKARDQVSIENIDENASAGAAAGQSAEDEASRRMGRTADEGGEG